MDMRSLFLFFGIGVIPSHLCFSSALDMAVGDLHVLAVKDSNQVYAWGANYAGQLGMGNVTGYHSPTAVPIAEPIAQIAAGRDHSCILLSDGTVHCWGNNDEGQLGLGKKSKYVGGVSGENVNKLPSLKLGDEKIKKLILGNHHTCVVTDGGKLKCFGSNVQGELGIGKTIVSLGKMPEDMGESLEAALVGAKVQEGCAGKFFTCALLETGVVKCWGSAIAAGNGTEKSLGTKVEEMNDSLVPVALGPSKVKQLACGDQSVCALLETGEVKCWGKNISGILGLGLANGEVIGDSSTEMGEALATVPVEPGLRVTEISCGYAHCCAVLENQAVKCWGGNSSGQLGLGDTKPRGLSLSEMGSQLPYVDLGAPNRIEKVQLGSVHSCALTQAGEIKCWGGNIYGQLALPFQTTVVGVFPEQMGESLKATLLTQ